MHVHHTISLKKSGFASYILLSVVAILFVSSVVIAVLISTNNIDKTDDELIAEALAAVAKVYDVSYEDIQVVQKSTSYARGTLFDTKDAQRKDFYAQRVNNQWEVVSVKGEKASCEIYSARGFDPAFISDCQKTYPDALSVEEAKKVLTITPKRTFLQIIASVASIDTYTRIISSLTGNGAAQGQAGAETETVTVVTLTSESGETITTEITTTTSGDTNNVEVGDTLVVTVTEPNQKKSTPLGNTGITQTGSSGGNPSNSGSNGGDTVATSVTNVTSDAGAIVPVDTPVGNGQSAGVDNQSGGSQQGGNSTSGNNSSGGVYRRIDTGERHGGLENVFDIDNSEAEVRVEG